MLQNMEKEAPEVGEFSPCTAGQDASCCLTRVGRKLWRAGGSFIGELQVPVQQRSKALTITSWERSKPMTRMGGALRAHSAPTLRRGHFTCCSQRERG